jgi:hypothetical protein
VSKGGRDVTPSQGARRIQSELRSRLFPTLRAETEVGDTRLRKSWLELKVHFGMLSPMPVECRPVNVLVPMDFQCANGVRALAEMVRGSGFRRQGLPWAGCDQNDATKPQIGIRGGSREHR